MTLTPLGNEFYQVVMRFGFMEEPNVPRVLRNVLPESAVQGLKDVTYFVGRETVFATKRRGMALWRERLFVIMARNALSASSFYHLPPGQVVELGAQVEI